MNLRQRSTREARNARESAARNGALPDRLERRDGQPISTKGGDEPCAQRETKCQNASMHPLPDSSASGRPRTSASDSAPVGPIPAGSGQLLREIRKQVAEDLDAVRTYCQPAKEHLPKREAGTPRTDAEYMQQTQRYPHLGMVVKVAFAEQLERELAAAKARIAELEGNL